MAGTLVIKVYPGCDADEVLMTLAGAAEPNGGDHIATVNWNGVRNALRGYVYVEFEITPGVWVEAPSSFLFTDAAETYSLRASGVEHLADYNLELVFDYYVVALYAPWWARVEDSLTTSIDDTSCKVVRTYVDQCTNIAKLDKLHVVIISENPDLVESVSLKFAESGTLVNCQKVDTTNTTRRIGWYTSGDEPIPNTFPQCAPNKSWVSRGNNTLTTLEYARIKYVGFAAFNDASFGNTVDSYRIITDSSGVIGQLCPNLPAQSITPPLSLTNARIISRPGVKSNRITGCTPTEWTLTPGPYTVNSNITQAGFSFYNLSSLLRFSTRRKIDFNFTLNQSFGPFSVTVSGYYRSNMCLEDTTINIDTVCSITPPPQETPCASITHPITSVYADYELGAADGIRLRARLTAGGTETVSNVLVACNLDCGGGVQSSGVIYTFDTCTINFQLG